jgi:drug/metabolite transporter (DMT)-like permease
VFPGSLSQVTWRSVVFIVILGVLTGTGAHGLMVYAQKSVPIGVISMLQVSQPALAVLWSVLFLGAAVRGIQIVGMALVILGLAAVTVSTQRSRDRLRKTNGELAGPTG